MATGASKLSSSSTVTLYLVGLLASNGGTALNPGIKGTCTLLVICQSTHFPNLNHTICLIYYNLCYRWRGQITILT